eukprot:482841_1
MGQCACSPFSTNTNNTAQQHTAVHVTTPVTPETPKELDSQQFETEVINNILNNTPINALNLCENIGIPIIVNIDSIKNTSSSLNIDEESESLYIRVQIDELQRFTNVSQQKLNPKFNENLLFIIPFNSINNIIKKDTLNITFTLYSHSTETNVSYMSNNTELLMDMNERKVSYNPSQNEYTMNTTVYEKSVYDELAGVDAVVKSPIFAINLFQKQSVKTLGNESTSNYIKSPTMLRTDSGIVKVEPMQLETSTTDLAAVKTYHTDRSTISNQDENCVGQYILEINLKSDVSVYHKQIQKSILMYKEDNKLLNVGEISYKIFLNVLQKYQQ